MKDYASRNRVPKHISRYIYNETVEWLQEPGYCQGHRRRKGGHRMVSGIVRARMKREVVFETQEK